MLKNWKEENKKRLLLIEIPAIERYNKTRKKDYKIQIIPNDDVLHLEFKIKPCENEYKCRVRLSSDYPIQQPTCFILTPFPLPNPRDKDPLDPKDPIPHSFTVYSGSEGEGTQICLWRYNQWDPGKFTAVFAIQCIARWLLCFEVWVVTGEWVIPEASA